MPAMPTRVSRFFEQLRDRNERLRDRNKWPRQWWYPAERYTKIDPKSEEWKAKSTETQDAIRNTVLAIIIFSSFCLLTLAAPDASLLDANAKVKIALLNIDIDYVRFLWAGPLVLIGLALYLHILLEDWFNKFIPQKQDSGSLDIYAMPPDIFNIQVHRLTGTIYNGLFYWIPIFVLVCFAVKWDPRSQTQDGKFFTALLSNISIPVLIWLNIRRCPDHHRLIKNLINWVALTYFLLSSFSIFPEIKITKIISEMKLYGVDLHRQDLKAITLPLADLRKANLQETNLQGANLREAKLQGASLQETNLQGANLREANLQGANLQKANLQGANLREAKLQGASLQETNLQGANLQGATLLGTKLCGADLRQTDLSGATLKDADLRQTDLSGATLKDADVSREQLVNAYYVKGEGPPKQPPKEVSDEEWSLRIRSEMVKDNRKERDSQIDEEKICNKPVPSLTKPDKNVLDNWVVKAKSLFEEKPLLAKEMLDVAIKADKKYVGAVFQLGRLLTIQAGKVKANKVEGILWTDSLWNQYKEAQRLFNEAINIAEANAGDGTRDLEGRKADLALRPDIYFNLGSVHMFLKDYKGAVDKLEECRKLSLTDDDRVLTNLGISYLKKEDPNKKLAKSLLEQALELNPTNDTAREELKRLK